MDPLLLGTATAFGLAASAGLNTTLPLLIVGLLARFGLIALAAPFDALGSEVALIGLAGLVVIELVGDKVVIFDTTLQVVQWPLAAAAGAILFASQTSVVSWVSPGLAILVGLLTAGAIHGARATIRPVVSTLTLGHGNPFVSAAEDAYALVLTGAAVFLPGLALVLIAILVTTLIVVVVWAVRHGWSLIGRVFRRGRPAVPARSSRP